MKTVAVIFGLIFLVYLVAWLGSLDMAARIAALLLIAVKAVGLGALVVRLLEGQETVGPDGRKAGCHNLPAGGVAASQKVTFPTACRPGVPLLQRSGPPW